MAIKAYSIFWMFLLFVWCVLASFTPAHAADTAASSTVSSVATTSHDALVVEEQVRNVFADVPVMVEIARCESKFRQYTDAGAPLRGGAGGGMIGVFQFNERIHAPEARRLGFDLASLEGNIAYARHLYDTAGTDPWMSSFSCWFDADESLSETEKLTANLTFGQNHDQVRVLQTLLNDAGFLVAASGPGSPGNETTMFGSLTRAAVRSFQCATDIACSGDEYSTGYGYVNAKTRRELLAYTSTRETDDAALIASLQARLKELQALLAELQKKRN